MTIGLIKYVLRWSLETEQSLFDFENFGRSLGEFSGVMGDGDSSLSPLLIMPKWNIINQFDMIKFVIIKPE